MSNCFSCNIGPTRDFSAVWTLSERLLRKGAVGVLGYYFFYCAQPNATSASVQNVTTNLREYYVKRLKIDYFLRIRSREPNVYMMFFVLCVPQDYIPSKTFNSLRLSELPNHTIPENVLYYNFVHLDSYSVDDQYHHTKNISIDIKKPFRVSPSYKLVFVCYYFTDYLTFNIYENDGTAQVEFAVN